MFSPSRSPIVWSVYMTGRDMLQSLTWTLLELPFISLFLSLLSEQWAWLLRIRSEHTHHTQTHTCTIAITITSIYMFSSWEFSAVSVPEMSTQALFLRVMIWRERETDKQTARETSWQTDRYRQTESERVVLFRSRPDRRKGLQSPQPRTKERTRERTRERKDEEKDKREGERNNEIKDEWKNEGKKGREK